MPGARWFALYARLASHSRRQHSQCHGVRRNWYPDVYHSLGNLVPRLRATASPAKSYLGSPLAQPADETLYRPSERALPDNTWSSQHAHLHARRRQMRRDFLAAAESVAASIGFNFGAVQRNPFESDQTLGAQHAQRLCE